MVDLSEESLNELKSRIPKEIGKRVRHFRKDKGLTQNKLALAVGKDRQYIYKIEKGLVTPNVVTISILAITLEVPLMEFFNIEF